MNTIELHPEGQGTPIVGEWEELSATYLVGRSGGMCWSPKIQPGDMPLAVLSSHGAAVCVSPVHPLCHVNVSGQAVTSMASGEILQLGAEKYRLHIVNSQWRNRRMRLALMMGALILIALIGGWYLHGVSNNAAIATPSALYTF